MTFTTMDPSERERIFSLAWRILTHVFMEQEVFGSKRRVQDYYATEGVRHPFTTSFKYTDSEIFYRITNAGVTICMFCTAVTLPAGLSMIASFVFRNLP